MDANPPPERISGASTRPSRLLVWERRVMLVVELFSALCVLAEILILLVGVLARYVFLHPLIWTDELAQAVFLWLGMIGASVALYRGEHMRMTALLTSAGPRLRAALDIYGAAAALVFLAVVMQPSLDYVAEVTRLEMPGLGVSKAWLTVPLPCGFLLMIVISLLRLFRQFRVPTATGITILAVACACAAPYADTWLESYGNLNLILFFVVIVGASVLAGVPIAVAFALSTFAYMIFNTDVPMLLFVGRFYEGMSHLILLAVPLFVFLGLLIEMTGMARAMVNFLSSVLGHVGGGLSYVLVGAMYLVSGISGSKAADMAAVAPALFPEMIKRGSRPGDLAASSAIAIAARTCPGSSAPPPARSAAHWSSRCRHLRCRSSSASP
jgi:TRAP-type C4-dicarboxylate transport system permease small subunit